MLAVWPSTLWNEASNLQEREWCHGTGIGREVGQWCGSPWPPRPGGHWTQCIIQLFLVCFPYMIEACYTFLPPYRVVNNQGNLLAYYSVYFFKRAQHSWKDVFDYLVIFYPLHSSAVPHSNCRLRKERHFHFSCLSVSMLSSHNGPWCTASAPYTFVA